MGEVEFCVENRPLDPQLNITKEFFVAKFVFRRQNPQEPILGYFYFSGRFFYKQIPTALRVHLRILSLKIIVQHTEKTIFSSFSCLSVTPNRDFSVGPRESIAKKNVWKSD